ncbi:MAG: hypothetical protein GY811_00905 [Myxococcales bacterium]|nr:hypothetical protein [Myxococcales bacterium]
MRQFSHRGFRIEQLSFEARILYSAFLVFAVAAVLVSVAYYEALVGDRPFDGAREYYAGDARSASAVPLPDEAVDDDGPELELPEEMLEDEATAAPMLLSMSKRKLLEVTHFHLFTLPIFLLVIAHIFMLCPMAPRAKSTAILSCVLSSGVHMLAPWLIFWGGASWAWLMPVTGGWMTLSMLVLILWPAWAMWRPTSARSA